MITDTTDIMIIRQSEWGIYDTIRTKSVYSCNGYVRIVSGESFKLASNEKLIELYKKESAE